MSPRSPGSHDDDEHFARSVMADELRELMDRCNMSASQLAPYCGRSERMIRNYLEGTSAIPHITMIRIRAACGIKEAIDQCKKYGIKTRFIKNTDDYL